MITGSDDPQTQQRVIGLLLVLNRHRLVIDHTNHKADQFRSCRNMCRRCIGDNRGRGSDPGNRCCARNMPMRRADHS